MEPVIDQVKKATVAGTSSLYTVSLNGSIRGLLEKFKGTRDETHPWKAFKGYGHNAKLFDCFYGPNGKKEAIDAILERHFVLTILDCDTRECYRNNEEYVHILNTQCRIPCKFHTIRNVKRL